MKRSIPACERADLVHGRGVGQLPLQLGTVPTILGPLRLAHFAELRPRDASEHARTKQVPAERTLSSSGN